MPGAESNFPRGKKAASFASYRSTFVRFVRFEDVAEEYETFSSRALLFAREIEKNVTKSFLQNEIYHYFSRYLLITLLRSNFVI